MRMLVTSLESKNKKFPKCARVSERMRPILAYWNVDLTYSSTAFDLGEQAQAKSDRYSIDMISFSAGQLVK
jgi:hypothetical protein